MLRYPGGVSDSEGCAEGETEEGFSTSISTNKVFFLCWTGTVQGQWTMELSTVEDESLLRIRVEHLENHSIGEDIFNHSGMVKAGMHHILNMSQMLGKLVKLSETMSGVRVSISDGGKIAVIVSDQSSSIDASFDYRFDLRKTHVREITEKDRESAELRRRILELESEAKSKEESFDMITKDMFAAQERNERENTQLKSENKNLKEQIEFLNGELHRLRSEMDEMKKEEKLKTKEPTLLLSTSAEAEKTTQSGRGIMSLRWFTKSTDDDDDDLDDPFLNSMTPEKKNKECDKEAMIENLKGIIKQLQLILELFGVDLPKDDGGLPMVGDDLAQRLGWDQLSERDNEGDPVYIEKLASFATKSRDPMDLVVAWYLFTHRKSVVAEETYGLVGWSAIHVCADNHCLSAMLEWFLKEGSVNPMIPRKMGQWMPIHFAAREGSARAIQSLINHGRIDLDCVKSDGWTPLMLAAGNNRMEAVSLLLQYGCDMNKVNESGQTALEIAKDGGHEEIAGLIASMAAQ